MFLESMGEGKNAMVAPTRAGYMVAFLYTCPRWQATVAEMIDGAENEDRDETRDQILTTLSEMMDEGVVNYKGEGIFALNPEYFSGKGGKMRLQFLVTVCEMAVMSSRGE